MNQIYLVKCGCATIIISRALISMSSFKWRKLWLHDLRKWGNLTKLKIRIWCFLSWSGKNKNWSFHVISCMVLIANRFWHVKNVSGGLRNAFAPAAYTTPSYHDFALAPQWAAAPSPAAGAMMFHAGAAAMHPNAYHHGAGAILPGAHRAAAAAAFPFYLGGMANLSPEEIDKRNKEHAAALVAHQQQQVRILFRDLWIDTCQLNLMSSIIMNLFMLTIIVQNRQDGGLRENFCFENAGKLVSRKSLKKS